MIRVMLIVKDPAEDSQKSVASDDGGRDCRVCSSDYQPENGISVGRMLRIGHLMWLCCGILVVSGGVWIRQSSDI